MKYHILCWLFGHVFVGKFNFRDIDEATVRWSIRPSEWCTRCGLSKGELGI